MILIVDGGGKKGPIKGRGSATRGVIVFFLFVFTSGFDLVSSLLIDFLNCNKLLLFSSCVLEYEGSGPIYLNKQNEPDWLVTPLNLSHYLFRRLLLLQRRQ